MTSHEPPQYSCSLFLSLTSTGKPCPESLQLPAVPLSLVKKTVFSGTNWSFAGFTTGYYKSASLSPIAQQIACPPTPLRKSKPRIPSVSHHPSLINIFRLPGTLLSLWSPGSKDGPLSVRSQPVHLGLNSCLPCLPHLWNFYSSIVSVRIHSGNRNHALIWTEKFWYKELLTITRNHLLKWKEKIQIYKYPI